jgi:hypothetical protein
VEADYTAERDRIEAEKAAEAARKAAERERTSHMLMRQLKSVSSNRTGHRN